MGMDGCKDNIKIYIFMTMPVLYSLCSVGVV